MQRKLSGFKINVATRGQNSAHFPAEQRQDSPNSYLAYYIHQSAVYWAVPHLTLPLKGSEWGYLNAMQVSIIFGGKTILNNVSSFLLLLSYE